MCVPVCMFVRTSTVLFPSRWWVVMSVTWIGSNCGHVGIRSPQGCVRSTSFISVGEVLHASELIDDVLGFLRLIDADLDDPVAVRRVVHRAIRAHERANDALGRVRIVLQGLRRDDIDGVL